MAVVTAYDPGPALATLVGQAAAQAAGVVVVDDGSTRGLDVLETVRRQPGVRVLTQPNAGVAAALNAGVRVALADGADAVLTLDQDSGLAPDYVDRAVATWQRAVTAGVPVALVAAARYGGHPAPTRGPVPGAEGFVRAFDPLTSGSLVPAATYARVGLHDEDLVIDAVDSELTVRCLAAGLEPLVGTGCELAHGMGERRHRRALGREWSWNRHDPGRVYYMARNGTLLTRRYARAEPAWVVRRLTEEAKAHLLRLTLDPDRRTLARAALAGLRDGLRGRTGRR